MTIVTYTLAYISLYTGTLSNSQSTTSAVNVLLLHCYNVLATLSHGGGMLPHSPKCNYDSFPALRPQRNDLSYVLFHSTRSSYRT